MDQPVPTRQSHMARVYDYLKGYHATHLLALGDQLGLHQAIRGAPGGLTAGDLAAKLGLDLFYTRVYCQTAYSLGILDQDPNGGYRFAPYMDEVIADPESIYYLGKVPALHLLMGRDYPKYPEFFRTGGTFPFQDHDELFIQTIAAASRGLPRYIIDAVLPRIDGLVDRLNAGARVLDVGCGSGYAIVALAERFPRVRCVGIDIEPTSIAAARQLIDERGLSDRVEARVVDDGAAPFSREFDLAMMILSLHEIHPSQKGKVVAQSIQALKPTGNLLILDEAIPENLPDLRDPTLSLTVMAQWYESIWGNEINTESEIKRLLEDQGVKIQSARRVNRWYIVTGSPMVRAED